MPLRIHNSMTGRKEALEPLEPGHVRMYVCGITVYDHIHVGHARSQIAFDVARRWLRASGYRVTYVRNITDIDDKIIDRARERGEPIEALTARFIASMDEDFAAIGLEKPDHEPRATAFIPEIVAMIGRLVAARLRLRRRERRRLLRGRAASRSTAGSPARSWQTCAPASRVEVDESKRDPLDFVLWKHAKPGEPAWDSPWGMGRPGWHIECSAMAVALLGPAFDIHGGGMDLKFPHHENEIAQSCAACDAPFAKLWMHNGFVRVDDEKMSKSLGNFFTVREVLPRLRPEVLRAFLLASHYRAPVNYTEDNLRQADASLQRLYLALRDVEPAPALRAGRGLARVRARRWTTTSTRRARSPRCSRQPARSTSPRQAATTHGRGRSRRRSGSSAGSSACSNARRRRGSGRARNSSPARTGRLRRSDPAEIERAGPGAHRGAPRARLRRVRPHPRPARGRRHRARGRSRRHHLAAEVTKGTRPFIFGRVRAAREYEGARPLRYPRAARTRACSS